MKTKFVFFIFTAGCFLFKCPAQSAWSQDTSYVLFITNGDVLHCPHFLMLIPSEAEKQLGGKVLRSDNQRYMLFQFPHTQSDLRSRFRTMLGEIQFPEKSIKEIILSTEYINPDKHLVNEE